MGGIWVFIPPKSAQVNSSWGKNDVRTAIQQFYTPPPKKKNYIPQKQISGYAHGLGECVLLYGNLYGYILIESLSQLSAYCKGKYSTHYVGSDTASKLVFLYRLLNYTVSGEKKSLRCFRHHFVKYRPIFKILSLSKSP